MLFLGGAAGFQSRGREHLVQKLLHDLVRNKLFVRNPRGCFTEISQLLIGQVELARHYISKRLRIQGVKKKSVLRWLQTFRVVANS
jgi:hypothetical protein